MNRFFFLIFIFPLLVATRSLHAQTDTTSSGYLWMTRYEEDDWVLGPHATSMYYDTTGALQAYGAKLDQYVFDGFCIRNRFLVGPHYFHFSTASLGMLLIKSAGDAEGCREMFGLIFLGEALMVFNDGVSYSVPVGPVELKPSFSPFSPFFSAHPGHGYSFHANTSAGLGISHVIRDQFDVEFSGEYLWGPMWTSGAKGWQFNFSLGWIIE